MHVTKIEKKKYDLLFLGPNFNLKCNTEYIKRNTEYIKFCSCGNPF